MAVRGFLVLLMLLASPHASAQVLYNQNTGAKSVSRPCAAPAWVQQKALQTYNGQSGWSVSGCVVRQVVLAVDAEKKVIERQSVHIFTLGPNGASGNLNTNWYEQTLFKIGDAATRPATDSFLTGAFDPSKPTVILTHGWQPNAQWGDRPGLFADLRNAIEARYNGNVNILEFNWRGAYQSPLHPFESGASTPIAGTELAAQLARILPPGYNHQVQLIGHSHGTVVNAYSLQGLVARGIDVSSVVMIDAPTRYSELSAEFGGTASGYGSTFFQRRYEEAGIDSVRNYYGTGIASTGMPIAGATNININATHTEAPGIVAAAIATGAVPIVPSLDIVISTPIMILPPSSQPLTSPAVLNPNGFAGTPSDFQLWEQSPNGLFFNVDVPPWASYMGFDFEVLDPGDGDWWTLHLGQDLLWAWSGETPFGSSQFTIPIASHAGQQNFVSLVLNSVGQANANARFSNLRFLSEATFGPASTAPVPEPATWAMMLLGFGFVGGAMRSAKRRQKVTGSYA